MTSNRVSTLKQLVKRAVHEAALHVQRQREPNDGPRVMILPSNAPWDPASNLRAWLVAPELRSLGWRTTVISPALSLSQRQRAIRFERPDVIFMQQTRHPLNRPGLYRPVPVVLDVDDADCLDDRYSEMIATAARDAAAVVGGSTFIAQWFSQHNADTTVAWTSTPVPESAPRVPPGSRQPLVAWAHSCPFRYPKEGALLQRALLLAAPRARFTFRLFGSTESEARDWFRPLRAAGVECAAVATMPYDLYLDTVAESAVGLQPVCSAANAFSQGKSFGKVLAYLSGAVAVVASNEVDHPLFFRHRENGLLLGDQAEDWADAIVELVSDTTFRARVGEEGRKDFLARLTTPNFARQIDTVLRRNAAGGSVAPVPSPRRALSGA